MPPAPCFLWKGGYEAKWLRKSGSLAWLGACETLGKRRKDPKLNSRSDQSWGPGGMKAKLENEVNMDLKSSKISPRELQHETNMGCPGASRRPLGAENGFRELFGVILDPPKSSKLELKFNKNEAPIWRYIFGCLEASGGHFGLHLGLPGASCHFYKK